METVLNESSNTLLTWLVIILISIGLWVYSLIDILKSSFEKSEKISWILMTLFVPIVGPFVYLMGKKGN